MSSDPWTGIYGSGWIKLHRQALEHGWLQNHRLWAFWCYCLLKASHKPMTVMVGHQRVSLESGQLLFGREKASAELGMTVKQVRTCLDSLKRAGNVAVKSASKFSIITVINWDVYQDQESEPGQQKGHESGRERASKGPAKGHIQECKELKKKSIPAKNPPEGFVLFREWWMYAFSVMEGDAYIFESGKDGACLSSMLKPLDVKELVCRACFYLTDAKRFPPGRPALSLFKASINRYPSSIGGKADYFRGLGILPPEGVLLEEWKPWEKQEEPDLLTGIG